MVRAGAAAHELAELAHLFGTGPLRAAARWAEGAVAAGLGELDRARLALDDAVALFDRSAMPYEAARARAELAGVLRRLGAVESSEQEERRSLEALTALGVAPTGTRKNALSRRELEVLRLIADGRTDRDIAGEL